MLRRNFIQFTAGLAACSAISTKASPRERPNILWLTCEDNKMTIHDMVQDPGLYPLPELLNAADLALDKKETNVDALYNLLKNKDGGIRFWGIVGLFLLNHSDNADQFLNDDSHEVRSMAAWLLIQTGQAEPGIKILKDLLAQKSYASLTVLNMIDWMGKTGQQLLPDVKAAQYKQKSYELRMQSYLLKKLSS